MQNVKIFMEKNTLKVKIMGEIDHHSAVDIRNNIDKEIYGKLPADLELDLSNVDFMDSSGLGLILGRYTKMKEIGGTLKIINPSIRVEKIILLAGVEKYITIKKEKIERIQK